MKPLAENRQARFDYEILENFEAGIVLSGRETKAARAGGVSLKGAFVTFQRGSAYLTNAHISPYSHAAPDAAYDPTRRRRLLLHGREIKTLRAKAEARGLTIVPLTVYTKDRFIKVGIALARGRKKYDKRAALKKRDIQREIRQTK